MKVQEALDKESLTLAKFKDAKMIQSASTSGTTQAEQESSDIVKVMMILELEMANQERVQELEEAKKKAQEAAEAAKQALEDSKLKEKEVQDAIKLAAQEQRAKADAILQAQSESEKGGAEVRREKKMAERAAAKRAAVEIAEIEKARAIREKERLGGLKALTGKGCMKALADDPANLLDASPKRPLPTADGSPNKGAKMMD